jgi:hypothetical protein
MMERIDYWRGFTGGFLAGVAIGAWVYFSPRISRKVGDYEGFDRERPDEPSLHRESAESVGDPSWLVPQTGNITRMDFERSGQSVG